jgi:hypothetical protein
MAITIIDRKSANLNTGGRREQTRFLVIHHTAGGTVESTIKTLQDRRLSYHYLVDKDGKVYQLVDDAVIAYHAFEANRVSVSISLVAPNDRGVTSPQVQAALELGRTLQRKYNLPVNAVYGHGEIALPTEKEPTEGLTVTNLLRNNQTPPPYNLVRVPEERQQRAVSGASSQSTSTNYFDRIYLTPLRTLANQGGNAGLLAQEVINKINVITTSPARTAAGQPPQVSLKTFIENNNSITPNERIITDVVGEVSLLGAVTSVNLEAQARVQSITSRVNGLLPAEAAFAIQYDLFEFFPDKMRQKMSINAVGENPNYSHAWRSPGKLAITANITIPGASGFRIGQIFWIGRTYEHYKNFGAFQLFGLTETIDLSRGWTTQLYARFNAMPTTKVATLKPV